METAVWIAIVTSGAAMLTAAFGWYVQRKQGLPSSFALTIRSELEEANRVLTGKAERLNAELLAEQAARAAAKRACDAQIERLVTAINDRDLLLTEMRQRLGMPEPKDLTDPHL